MFSIGDEVTVLGDQTAHGQPIGQTGIVSDDLGGVYFGVRFPDAECELICHSEDLQAVGTPAQSTYTVGLSYDTSLECLSILSDLVAWSKYSEAANIQDIIARAAKVLEANAAKQDGL